MMPLPSTRFRLDREVCGTDVLGGAIGHPDNFVAHGQVRALPAAPN